MKTDHLIQAILMCALLLMACNLLQPEQAAPTPTAEPANSAPCAFVWASKGASPEDQAALEKAFMDGGLPNVKADISLFGENCVDEKGNVVSFGAKDNDISLIIPVTDLQDEASLGNLLEKCIHLLQDLPGGTLPAPYIGNVNITLQSGSASVDLNFNFSHARQALEDGLQGAALYQSFKPNP